MKACIVNTFLGVLLSLGYVLYRGRIEEDTVCVVNL